MSKLYPVGVQNFEGLIHDGYVYVDKTAQVYELFNTNKYYFLSRPRRFGKSLLLSTIEAYALGKKDLTGAGKAGKRLDRISGTASGFEHTEIRYSRITDQCFGRERTELGSSLWLLFRRNRCSPAFPGHYPPCLRTDRTPGSDLNTAVP